MTFKYNDVYVKDTATVAGPYEKKGPLKNILIRPLMIYILKKIPGKKLK